ncbi:MAG: protein kinase [Fimbriimonadaceae bacterium]|nr:protein kinase [Fimbriimonadaceae bacterium]QYK55696.1 MAG: protein kinase [Fimbriimonadaceae bacterium]
MSQSPPTTLGKYQIIREIARSNDIVYEAYDPLMNRRVAVKELAMPVGASQQQRDDRISRFMREARAAGSLVHPNIVTVYEVGEQEGRRFIAMEYLDGQNLRNLLDTKGFVPAERAIEIAQKILSGLEFAHSRGVIHRDVKPDNVQLLESGEVKLTDFGIARLTFEPNLTMDGQVFGTPSYMSPEQINGREIDARSDLFSVGVILYEMLSGQKPFPGDGVVAITYAIMNKEPQQPTNCNHALWQVILQALDKSPQLRFSSAKEMAAALQSAAATLYQTVIDPPAPTLQAVVPPPVVVPQQPHPAYTHPYGTVQPPQSTAYGNPYGAPYGAPYGGQQPMATPYGPGGPPAQYGSPYGQIPVYYPPPPRPPMFSAATKQTFGKIFVAVLLVGALFVLVFQGINALTEAFRPAGSRAARSVSPGGWPNLGSPTPSAEDERWSNEEMAIAAIEEAKIEFDPVKRRGLWSRSSRRWIEAIDADPDPREASRRAVVAFVTAASDLANAGDPMRAREALYEAQGFAQGQPDLEQVVDSWETRLGG